MISVSGPLSTRTKGYFLQLEANLGVDGKWNTYICHHIHPKRQHSILLSLPTRGRSHRHLPFRSDHIHRRHMDCKLSDCSNHHSLYMDPTYLHMGKHLVLVYFLTLLWCSSTRILRPRIQTPDWSSGTRTRVLDCHVVSCSRCSSSLLHLHGHHEVLLSNGWSCHPGNEVWKESCCGWWHVVEREAKFQEGDPYWVFSQSRCQDPLFKGSTTQEKNVHY